VINLERLNMLKPGAVLVNTARGILIDNDALAAVAGRGEIGVYLDVTYPEPLPKDHPLRSMPNVVITPHIAGPTVEGWPRMGEACVADVERFVKGERVQYPVTEQQYANQSTT
jgi:phosphoglycerate dehydrogenase-like enzyme